MKILSETKVWAYVIRQTNKLYIQIEYIIKEHSNLKREQSVNLHN